MAINKKTINGRLSAKTLNNNRIHINLCDNIAFIPFKY